MLISSDRKGSLALNTPKVKSGELRLMDRFFHCYGRTFRAQKSYHFDCFVPEMSIFELFRGPLFGLSLGLDS